MKAICLALICVFQSLGLSTSAGSDVEVRATFADSHAVSNLLYGLFFEEINHAGEGGLYAEMIQDRSFDALAITSNFWGSGAESLEISTEAFRSTRSPEQRPVSRQQNSSIGGNSAVKKQLHAPNQLNQPISWNPLSSTKVFLTKTDPLGPNNQVALNVTAYNPGGGIANSGFWGVPLNGGWIYHFSIYIKGDRQSTVQILFREKHSGKVYGEATFEGIDSTWRKFSANITANATDFQAEVAVQLLHPGSVLIDSLSLFPGGNLRPGWQNPYPFRQDLLQLLKDLRPRFLRFPGGCYVEGGDWLRNRFPWETSLGPYENRTGHLNDVWGYWSTDGLGLYEYMLLADELGAEPIYVVNNGISHQQSTPVAQLRPFLQETLDAMEFLTEPSHTRWGAVRASMGREEPWKIRYLAVGNEDCGKPWYVEDYNQFYVALKGLYPNITLIANCNMGANAPTDIWDWHSYDESFTMFNRMHEFDNLRRGIDPSVFVSEYAVTSDGGWGNLKGAVAEASFMTGMERNSDIIKLASYAPLFVHTENRIWPTNMIVFDNHRAYKTPSYLVQQLFSQFQGKVVASTAVEFKDVGDVHNELVAASTTCQDAKCTKVAVKAVNFNSYEQDVTVVIKSNGGPISFEDSAVLHHVSGAHGEAENSFDLPDNVVLAEEDIKLSGTELDESFSFRVTLPSWSASVIELTAKPQPSTSVIELTAKPQASTSVIELTAEAQPSTSIV